MSFYWVKTNSVIKRLFRNQIWSVPNNEKKIYLTFDDGPTPQVTQWVLSILKENNIKATFFCIGKNVADNLDIYNQILLEEHSIGNHTFNHLNGWKTTTKEYLENIKDCENIFQKKQNTNKLFRPPYGKISKKQSKLVRKSGYKIIMWDVLSADFDQTISPEKCLENATKKVTSGSIIVFHDSVKAFKNLEYTLPRAIAHYKGKGFVFDVL